MAVEATRILAPLTLGYISPAERDDRFTPPPNASQLYRSRADVIHLGGNTNLEREVYRGQGNVAAAVGRFGAFFPYSELFGHMEEPYKIEDREEFEKLLKGTGFDGIHRWETGLPRADQVGYELEVAADLIATTREVMGWRPQDVDIFFLGSGVPITDEIKGTRYVDVLARENGLENAVLHEANLACNSWVYELFRVLEEPEFQGKRAIVGSMDGVTTLTSGFDPKQSDLVATIVFSNGAGFYGFEAGKGIRKDEKTKVHHVAQRDIEALRAHMTYPVNPDNDDLIQEEEGRVWVVGTKPDGGLKLQMKGGQTTKLFVRIGGDLIATTVDDHRANHPGEPDPDIAAIHNASLAVVQGAVNRAKSVHGVEVAVPARLPDGNASGASTPIGKARGLGDFAPEKPYIVGALGAGTSNTMGEVVFGE